MRSTSILNQMMLAMLLRASLDSAFLKTQGGLDWLGSIFSIFFSAFGIFTAVFIILILILFPLLDSFGGSLEEAGAEILVILRRRAQNLTTEATVLTSSVLRALD